MVLARLNVLGVAALVVLLAGCNQDTTESQTPEQPAVIADAEPAAPAELPPAPEPIPSLTELPVNSVDSVMLSRPADAPNAMIIRVLGTTASGGWSLPKLEPMADGSSDASILTYQLMATSPEAPDDTNTASQQIETELRIDALPMDVMTIRIVSATNDISAPVTQ